MIYKELLKGSFEKKEMVDQLFSRLQSKMFKDSEIILDLEEGVLVSAYFLNKLENLIIRSKELETKVSLTNISPQISKCLHVLNCKKSKKPAFI